jgi:Ycf66 protein N-terminus
MLAHILALAVGFASFSLYMAAFFFPEVHRKYDLIWSGVGMFYALVLWVCAGRITGGVLLGQTASVVLLGWLGWQTLNLRRDLTPIDQQTTLPGNAKTIGEAAQIKLQALQSRWQQSSSLPGGLDKAPGQLGQWLTIAKDLAQGVIASVNKPKSKRQPPPGVRPIARPAEINLVPTATEAELDAELAATTEAVSEVMAAAASEPVVETSYPTPDLAESDQDESNTAIASNLDSDDLDDFEPDSIGDAAPEPEPGVVNTAQQSPVREKRQRSPQSSKQKKQQSNSLFANLRNRVQGTLSQFNQPKGKPTVQANPSTPPTSPSLDDWIEALEEDEPMELEVTTVAVLEDAILEADAIDAEAVEIIEVVEMIEVEVVDQSTELFTDDDTEPETVTAETADVAEANLAPEQPGVSMADALLEEEINWEAGTSPEPIEQAAIDHQPEPASEGTEIPAFDSPIPSADEAATSEPSSESSPDEISG